jgi:hypothetical protein
VIGTIASSTCAGTGPGLQSSLSAVVVLVVQEVMLMAAEAAPEPLDRDTAVGICQQVQVRGKRWSAAWWQCWGCRRFSGGDPEKMCIAAKPGYRGV